jgi:predicted cupin superfamily sugar epimerase
MNDRARTLIQELRLEPHPEGGYYREIYRSPTRIQTQDDRGSRDALTTIYFLLTGGQVSRWHRVRSDEVWHLYEGGPLQLLLADAHLAQTHSVTLTQASKDRGPVHTVPAGWWQAARCDVAFALVGCTVAPGFEFADFSFMRDDPDLSQSLRQVRPEWQELL